MSGVLNFGWYPTGKKWVPLKVDEHGSIVIACTVDELNDIGDVAVPTPTDDYFLYWDAATSSWKCRALVDADIPAAIARDAEVTADIATHAAIADAHHTKYTNAEAKAAAVLAGAITNGETKAPTHDAVYDVKVTADAAQTAAEVDADIATHAADKDAHHSNLLTLTFIIDGGGSAITTGEKGHLRIPFACTINRVTMLADVSGSIVVDIWKDTYANFPPTDADSITASAPPTITTAQKSEDSTLTGWTTAITADDILAFNVDSCTTIERVTISLKVTKT